jgi:hypothetical protein
MQCGRARSQSQSPRRCCAVPREVPPLGAAAGGGRTARCHRRHTHRAPRACRRFVAWSRSLRRATIGAGVDLGGSALRRARLPLHRLRRRRRRVLHHPQMVAAPRSHLGPSHLSLCALTRRPSIPLELVARHFPACAERLSLKLHARACAGHAPCRWAGCGLGARAHGAAAGGREEGSQVLIPSVSRKGPK